MSALQEALELAVAVRRHELNDTKTRFLVTFIDDHSRFVLASTVMESVTSEATASLLRTTARSSIRRAKC